MKRILLSLLILLSLSNLFAGITNSMQVITKDIPIQGAFGSVAELSVETIPAMANGYMHGMPFNIEEPYVWYGNGDGRMIANWSFVSNSNFIIEITASKMRNDDKSLAAVATPLNYNLKFFCIPSYINSSGVSVANSQYTFNVSTTDSVSDDTTYIWEAFSDIARKEGSYIGSVNGSIYFQFDSASTTLIKSKNNTAVPPGSYSAIVTMKILTKD